jgi:hypothetical protein
MPESRPPIELRGLPFSELQRFAEQRKLPPVDQWDPPHCGHSGMRILHNGTWLHEGRPIERDAMVRLFSTILRREPDGTHVLVTPVEKLVIDVDGTAFRAVEMLTDGSGRHRKLAFRLDSDDLIVLGPDHPLSRGREERSPRISVRHGLEAELSRPVYYELAELALAESPERPGIWSCGAFFSLSEEA